MISHEENKRLIAESKLLLKELNMSHFKKECPPKMVARIEEALCNGPLDQTIERTCNEIRDYASQILAMVYIQDCTKIEALDQICDYFGLKRPSEE